MKTVTYNIRLMERDMAARGWMKIDLARMAEVSDMTVYRWFDGRCRTAKTAKKIAFALGWPVERYLTGSASGRPSRQSVSA